METVTSAPRMVTLDKFVNFLMRLKSAEELCTVNVILVRVGASVTISLGRDVVGDLEMSKLDDLVALASLIIALISFKHFAWLISDFCSSTS